MKEWMTTNFYYPSIIKYGIESSDTLILDWIYSFAFSGRMKSMELYCSETKRNETYYWVNYEALIKDYNGELGKKGLLSVTSKSGLAKRLAQLVQKNILYFYLGNMVDEDGTIHRGKYTFFAINMSLYYELTGRKKNDAETPHCTNFSRQKNFIHRSPDEATPSHPDGRPGIAGQGETNIIKLEYYKAISSSSQKQNEKINEGDNCAFINDIAPDDDDDIFTQYLKNNSPGKEEHREQNEKEAENEEALYKKMPVWKQKESYSP